MAVEPRGEACAARRANHREREKAVAPLQIVGFVNALGNADQKSDPAGDAIGPAGAAPLRAPHRDGAGEQAPEQAPAGHEADRRVRKRTHRPGDHRRDRDQYGDPHRHLPPRPPQRPADQHSAERAAHRRHHHQHEDGQQLRAAEHFILPIAPDPPEMVLGEDKAEILQPPLVRACRHRSPPFERSNACWSPAIVTENRPGTGDMRGRNTAPLACAHASRRRSVILPTVGLTLTALWVTPAAAACRRLA
jgi:hypothetical protein